MTPDVVDQGFHALDVTPDGGVVGLGVNGEGVFKTVERSIRLTRFAPDGTVLWAKDYGKGIASGVVSVDGAGFAFLGGDDSLANSAMLVRTDEEGNVLWSKGTGTDAFGLIQLYLVEQTFVLQYVPALLYSALTGNLMQASAERVQDASDAWLLSVVSLDEDRIAVIGRLPISSLGTSLCTNLNCDDGNACTLDFLAEGGTECLHSPIGFPAPCDTGNSCMNGLCVKP